jgi:type II secretory pathway component PulJ
MTPQPKSWEMIASERAERITDLERAMRLLVRAGRKAAAPEKADDLEFAIEELFASVHLTTSRVATTSDPGRSSDAGRPVRQEPPKPPHAEPSRPERRGLG